MGWFSRAAETVSEACQDARDSIEERDRKSLAEVNKRLREEQRRNAEQDSKRGWW